jgi:hypothetical protein
MLTVSMQLCHPTAEAVALVGMVQRGVLDAEGCRRLIIITPVQALELRRVFGRGAAANAIAFRRRVLAEFDRRMHQRCTNPRGGA